MTDIHAHRILILDFGSQYTQLIARRVREAGVYCEIWPYDNAEEVLREHPPAGVILSGGPETVTADESPRAPEAVFTLGVPVLGICYGMQTMAAQLGGRVEPSGHREFGYAMVRPLADDRLLHGLVDTHLVDGSPALHVWMSHGDRVESLPEGFQPIASTDNAPLAGMADESRRFYGLQFHWKFTDLVNKQRSAVRSLEQSALVFRRAGERAFDVTEKFAFNQLFTECAAIDNNEWSSAAGRIMMNVFGNAFLADTAFAE